jgi:hypothetical protein
MPREMERVNYDSRERRKLGKRLMLRDDLFLKYDIHRRCT